MDDVATFSRAEQIELLGPRLTVDLEWEQQFGEDIPDHLRIIPDLVVYLIGKYEVLVPQWLLASAVASSCSLKTGSGSCLAKGTALNFIEEAEAYGLISSRRPGDDPRQRLYYLSHEQKTQRMNVLAVEKKVHALAEIQAKDPTNKEAGLTDENRTWYQNPLDMLLRQDEISRENVAKLKRITAILKAGVQPVYVGLITAAVFLATYGSALAGLSKVRD